MAKKNGHEIDHVADPLVNPEAHIGDTAQVAIDVAQVTGMAGAVAATRTPRAPMTRGDAVRSILGILKRCEDGDAEKVLNAVAALR